MRRRALPSAVVLWEGASTVNRQKVVAIATGLVSPSRNRKTGPMATVWYLRQDVHPAEAIRRRADRAICGDCAFRGDHRSRICYMMPMTPSSIWTAYRAGHTRRFGTDGGSPLRSTRFPTRLGGYGDPTCVPFGAIDVSARHTGYTSLWGTCDPLWRFSLMASAKTLEEALEAQALGWRTYRTILSGERLLPNEIHCPHDPADAQSPQCKDCMLCDGSRGRGDQRASIANVVHGGSGQAAKYRQWRASLPVVG